VNLAFSSLLLTAALVPGIAFLNTYYAGKFPRALVGLTPLTELALYFLWALPIDAMAIRVFGGPLEGWTLELTASLLGFGERSAGQAALIEALRGDGWWNLLTRYAAVMFTAVLAGTLARRVVWATRLDIFFPMLRIRAEWYYVLQGRMSGIPRRVIPEADVLVQHPDGSRLYAGIVAGFEPTPDGNLKELSLVAAQRHKPDADAPGDFVDIPGDRFAIMGSTIHSINMRYFRLVPPDDTRQKIAWYLRGIYRSLVFEEP